MASTPVYSPTTVSDPKTSWCIVPSEYLDMTRFWIKVCQMLLSFLAFILEEVVVSCIRCTALYFFEFVSCTAFLFTTMLLVLLSTCLYTKVDIRCWPSLDFVYTGGIAFLFLITSIIFASNNGKTTMEDASVAFGFLASFAFLIDLALQFKNGGLPFKKDGKPEPSNGGVTATAPAETEKLNTVANGTEEV